MSLRELRTRAERALHITRSDVDSLSRKDVKTLVHELQVHQIELEMQTEALQVTQLELMDSLAQYQGLFESAPIGYVTLDEQGLVTRVNEAASALLGLPCTSLMGRTLEQLLNADARAEYQRILGNAEVCARAQLEVAVATPANGTLYLQLDISRNPGPAGGCLVALMDVSQRKRNLEAAARAARELEIRVADRTAELTAKNQQLEAEIAGRAKSEALQRSLEAKLRDSERFESLGLLAGGIAHDFNNLLVGVMGNAELISLTPKLPEVCREPLALIVRACRQSLLLTRQLLVSAGKGGQLTMVPVNLPKVAAENLELLRERVPPEIQLQVKVGRDVPAIRGDRAQINQLMINVLTNALEAVSGSGVVAVETREQRLDAEALAEFAHALGAQPGRFVVLTVRDSGPGMDEQRLARIFDPFFSTKFPGRGLGLATVRGIVKAHQGALRVRSAPGTGTCFEIALPVLESLADSAPAASKAAQEWRGSGPILLVDDDNAVRNVFSKLLSVLGFTVTEAVSGNQALELFRADPERFQLLVLDWIMPGMTGKQTLEAVRALAPELPVILISGYNPEDLGTYDAQVICLQKPMTLADLREAAYRLLVGNAAERRLRAH